MAVTLPDVVFDNDDTWISLNQASGIAVGTRFAFRVKTRWEVTVIEDTTEPPSDDERGVPVDGREGNNEQMFETGALEIWAKARAGTRITCFEF